MIFVNVWIWFKRLITPSSNSGLNTEQYRQRVLMLVIMSTLTSFFLYWYVKSMQVSEVHDNWERISLNIFDIEKGTFRPDTLNVIVFKSFVPPNIKNIKVGMMPQVRDKINMDGSGIYYTLNTVINPPERNISVDTWLSTIEINQNPDYPFALQDLKYEMKKRFSQRQLSDLAYMSVDRFDICEPKILQTPFSRTSPAYYASDNNTQFMYKVNNTEGVFNSGDSEIQKANILFRCENANIRLISSGCIKLADFTESSWMALYDVSRVRYTLTLPKHAYIESVIVTFGTPTEFILSEPTPDEIGECQILYKDIDKIKFLQRNGLTFTAKFPVLENFQNVKIFIFTSILAFLSTMNSFKLF